jgi:hypothetical protein
MLRSQHLHRYQISTLENEPVTRNMQPMWSFIHCSLW